MRSMPPLTQEAYASLRSAYGKRKYSTLNNDWNCRCRFQKWLTRATESRVLTVLPLDRDVVVALDALPTRFHGDPADRLIVATARSHGLPLATRDRAIRRSRTTQLWSP